MSDCPYIVSTKEGTNHCSLSAVNNDQVSTVFLAFSLACKQLAAISNEDGDWWSQHLGIIAQSLIHSDSVSPEQLEQLMKGILPKLEGMIKNE